MSRTINAKTVYTSVKYSCTAPGCVKSVYLVVPESIAESSAATVSAWALAPAEKQGWTVRTVNQEKCPAHN